MLFQLSSKYHFSQIMISYSIYYFPNIICIASNSSNLKSIRRATYRQLKSIIRQMPKNVRFQKFIYQLSFEINFAQVCTTFPLAPGRKIASTCRSVLISQTFARYVSRTDPLSRFPASVLSR